MVLDWHHNDDEGNGDMAQAIEVDGHLELRCEWFVKCTNSTLLAVKHPMLGLVPTCERCASKAEQKTVKIEVTR